MIGYFAPPSGTKIHVVVQGKPVCGTGLNIEAVFQWCGDARNPRFHAYVDCKFCQQYLTKAKEARQWPFNAQP